MTLDFSVATLDARILLESSVKQNKDIFSLENIQRFYHPRNLSQEATMK